jgi:hypothetical protein
MQHESIHETWGCLFCLELVMNTQRIVGAVLLVVGLGLLIVGMNASHSAVDQLHDTFTGRFTHETAMYIFGGGAAALFGLLLVLFGVRGSNV